MLAGLAKEDAPVTWDVERSSWGEPVSPPQKPQPEQAECSDYYLLLSLGRNAGVLDPHEP